MANATWLAVVGNLIMHRHHLELGTNGIMGEKYLINIVEKENPAN
jgi:hypothetical protein